MEIKLNLQNSINATIEIEGRVMNFSLHGLFGKEPGLHPLTDEERHATIGGIVAGKLCDVLPDILQGFIPETESPDNDCWQAWEKLPASVADKMCLEIV